MKYYELQRLHIDDIQPGMELGKMLYANDGRLILCEGTIISMTLLAHLKKWGISSLEIQREVTNAKISNKIGMDETQKFALVYNKAINSVKEAFQSARVYAEISIDRLVELSEDIITSIVNSHSVINYLFTLKNVDDYTFTHSVNVAILAGVIGKWMGYSGKDISQLILAGILHDVGKTQVPITILTKPCKLTADEMEIMKLHVAMGYELVSQSGYNMPWSVACGILQHHERLDGSGYPHNVVGEQIHDFAKIIAVADIYDAITSNRVYRPKRTPFAVVEALKQDMFGKLDPTVCTTFLNNVANHFIGNIVYLNDGRLAEVIALSKIMSARPIVKTEDGEFLDLEARKDLDILEVVSIA